MRDVAGVFVTAGRLLLRHWPALLVLGLVGAAVRRLAVAAATTVSEFSGVVGQAMLVLAPLGLLLPIVGMLLVCRRSLPALAVIEGDRPVAPTEGRPIRLVDVAVSVLVPFLAVYTAYGLLDDDVFRFRNAAAADDFLRSRFTLTPEAVDTAARLAIYSWPVAVAIVAGAWLLRWALGRAERAVHLRLLAFLGALVELYYTVQVASQLIVVRTDGRAWLEDRVAVQWLHDGYDAVLDALGPVAAAFGAAARVGQDVVGSLDAVVVVPVAWLAFAAVVLGHQLADPHAAKMPRRGPAGLVGAVWDDVLERFSALADGLRLQVSAGLVPMLALSAGIVVVTRLPVFVHDIVRLVVGPREFATWLIIVPYEQAVTSALSLVLTAPLLAAAVDWLVRTRTARRPARRTGVSPTTAALR